MKDNNKLLEKPGEKNRWKKYIKIARVAPTASQLAIYHLARARGNEVRWRGTWHVTVSSPRDFHNRDIFLRPPRFFSSTRRKLMYGSWLEWLYIHEGNSRSPEGKASRRDIPWEKLYSFAPENCTRCVTEFCRACSLIDFSASSVPAAGLETFASASPIFSLPSFPLWSIVFVLCDSWQIFLAR